MPAEKRAEVQRTVILEPITLSFTQARTKEWCIADYYSVLERAGGYSPGTEIQTNSDSGRRRQVFNLDRRQYAAAYTGNST